MLSTTRSWIVTTMAGHQPVRISKTATHHASRRLLKVETRSESTAEQGVYIQYIPQYPSQTDVVHWVRAVVVIGVTDSLKVPLPALYRRSCVMMWSGCCCDGSGRSLPDIISLCEYSCILVQVSPCHTVNISCFNAVVDCPDVLCINIWKYDYNLLKSVN